MAKLLFAISVVGFVVWVYTLIDCIRTDDSRARGLPKIVWIFVVIALPLIGSVLWFTIGKERNARPGERPVQRQKAPDDDPAFLGKIGMEQDREKRIRNLEERLAELDDDDSNNQKD
jgi:hypothetical protein